MTNLAERLSSISEHLNNGVAGPTVTVRELLSWFNSQRRGYWVVKAIKRALEEHDLVTEPNFESTWIDGVITVKRKSNEELVDEPLDPTFRLGRLDAANKEIVSVAPNDKLERATTLMLTNDFSQLPVMVGARDVKGMITWKTIGIRLALGRPCQECRDAMETAQLISDEVSLLEAVEVIATHDYVLVTKADKTISGVVTASDLGSQFKTLSEPFLLVGEIESGIRNLLYGKFNKKQLQAAQHEVDSTREVNTPSDLTFGEYIRLLEPDDNWAKLGLRIDRKEFIRQLNRVRETRNDVMHFDPDGLDPEDKKFLVEFASFLKKLREVRK